MKVDIKEIKTINWQYLVNRREALLFTSITSNSYKYFEKITGIPWKVNHEIRFADGDIFYAKKDLDKLRSLFIKRGDKVFFDFRKRLLIYVNKLNKIASEAERTNCSKLTKDQLIKLLEFLGSFSTPRAGKGDLYPLKFRGCCWEGLNVDIRHSVWARFDQVRPGRCGSL